MADFLSGVAKECKALEQRHEATYDGLLQTVDGLIGAMDAALAVVQPQGAEGEGSDVVMAEAREGSSSVLEILSAVTTLEKKAVKGNYAKAAGECRKPFRLAVAKTGKAIEKELKPVPAASPDTDDLESHLVDEAVVRHFLRLGRVRSATAIMEDTMNMDCMDLKTDAYQDMLAVERAIAACRLQDAFAWAEAHRQKLDLMKSPLEFKLHQLQLVTHLANNPTKKLDAVKYAREHFKRFHATQQKEIQKTMMLLLYCDTKKEHPYADLLSPTLIEELAACFRQNYCSIYRLPEDSPLLTATMAGIMAMKPLRKMAGLARGEWGSMEQLPVEVNLGSEFKYHSLFVCPVSKDHATEDNPPTMLVCGHVICKSSMEKIARSVSTRARFKCPYCPTDQQPSKTKRLYF